MARRSVAVGRPHEVQPDIAMWLEERDGEVHLVAKHALDANEQRLAIFDFRRTPATVTVKRVYAPRLAAAFSSDRGQPVPAKVEPR